MAALVGAFQRVATEGRTELILLSGYPGIGKSTVARELQRAVSRPRGFFVSARFDPVKQDAPYATLADAFRSLVRQVLAQGPQAVAAWKTATTSALGPNGRLVNEVIPELELLTGPLGAVQSLAAREAQNRFHAAFRSFVQVFARPGHPLVVFLDDLHWLDPASQQLLEHLLTHPEMRHLLVIGAYRGSEVGAFHPLSATVTAARQAGTPVGHLVLAPLTQEGTEQMVADTLLCDPDRSAALARLVHEKTAGNPFFTIQFLAALREEGLLGFDAHHRMWHWDLEGIQAREFTDNVVDPHGGQAATPA